MKATKNNNQFVSNKILPKLAKPKTEEKSKPKKKNNFSKWINNLFSRKGRKKKNSLKPVSSNLIDKSFLNKPKLGFLTPQENIEFDKTFKAIPKIKWANSDCGKIIAKELIELYKNGTHHLHVVSIIIEKYPNIIKEKGFEKFCSDFLCAKPGMLTVVYHSQINEELETYWGLDKCREVFAKRGLAYVDTKFNLSTNGKDFINIVKAMDPDDYGYRLGKCFSTFDLNNMSNSDLKNVLSVMGKRNEKGEITEAHQTCALLEILKRNVTKEKLEEIIFLMPAAYLIYT